MLRDSVLGAGAGSSKYGDNPRSVAPRRGWDGDYGVTVCLSRGRKVRLDGWWSARLGAVVSWENGSNRQLRVV